MDNKITYTKLSNLVDQDFTITKAGGYQFKKWDDASKRMLVEERYVEGYRKLYTIDTDKGRMDLGSGQLANLLEAVYKNGQADINGKTFHVKSNGKTGMDIRYYFNAIKKQEQAVENAPDDFGQDNINLDDIPF
jgi:hypothetical protein